MPYSIKRFHMKIWHKLLKLFGKWKKYKWETPAAGKVKAAAVFGVDRSDKDLMDVHLRFVRVLLCNKS